LILSAMMRWSSPSFYRHRGGRRRWHPSSDWWVPPIGRIPNRYPDPAVAGLASWANLMGYGPTVVSFIFFYLTSFFYFLFCCFELSFEFWICFVNLWLCTHL
jgi:hypothetical protein